MRMRPDKARPDCPCARRAGSGYENTTYKDLVYTIRPDSFPANTQVTALQCRQERLSATYPICDTSLLRALRLMLEMARKCVRG